MTLHDFFLGGSMLRVTFFVLGIAYCIHHGRGRSLAALALAGSIVILILLMFSREWATFLGIPVSVLIVERLTELVRIENRQRLTQALLEDQHEINEQLLAQLMREDH